MVMQTFMSLNWKEFIKHMHLVSMPFLPLKHWDLHRLSILPRSTDVWRRLRMWVWKTLEAGKVTGCSDHLLYIKQMTFPSTLTLIPRWTSFMFSSNFLNITFNMGQINLFISYLLPVFFLSKHESFYHLWIK